MLAGPTTLLAMLNSLQMGFRTLALEKRSAEVWEVLGAVKTEFGKFGDVLAKTREEAQGGLPTPSTPPQTRTNEMARALKTVEALPRARSAQTLLPGLDADRARSRRGRRPERLGAPGRADRRPDLPARLHGRRAHGRAAAGAARGPQRRGWWACCWAVRAAPIVLALQAGRLADRRGYHRPMRLAVALTIAGAALALAVDLVAAVDRSPLLCVAALLVRRGRQRRPDRDPAHRRPHRQRPDRSSSACSAGSAWRRRCPTWSARCWPAR